MERVKGIEPSLLVQWVFVGYLRGRARGNGGYSGLIYCTPCTRFSGGNKI